MDRPVDAGVRSRRRMLKIVLPLVAVLALWLGVRLVFSWLGPSVRRDAVIVATVERGTVEAAVQATGILQPESETVLTSPMETRVLRVFKTPGAILAKGDPILALDTAGVALELERLVEKLALEENRKQQRRLSRDQKLKDNQAAQELVALDLKYLEVELARGQELADKGLASAQELLAARLNRDKKKVEARQLLEAREDEIAAADAELAGHDLETSILEKNRRELRAQMARASCESPRAGVLTWVVGEEGTSLARGEIFAKVADMSDFKVVASISDFHASRLIEGLAARVTIAGETLPGTVTQLLPAVEGGILKFEVVLARQPVATRANQRADVHVINDARQDVLRLKKGTAIRGSGFQELFVIRGDYAYKTKVDIGVSGINACEIHSGLEAGDEVIISDTALFAHLERLRVKP